MGDSFLGTSCNTMYGFVGYRCIKLCIMAELLLLFSADTRSKRPYSFSYMVTHQSRVGVRSFGVDALVVYDVLKGSAHEATIAAVVAIFA